MPRSTPFSAALTLCFLLTLVGCTDAVVVDAEPEVDPRAELAENTTFGGYGLDEPQQPTPTPVENTGQEEPPPIAEGGGACVTHPDPSSLPSCCEASESRCVPQGHVDSVLWDTLEACGPQGLCVPSKLLVASGVVTPKACTSIGGAPGACGSVCIPDIGDVAGLLPQDVCIPGDRCVPCISPLDGQDTGVCDSFECAAEAPAVEPEPEPEPEVVYTCENPPLEPPVDVTLFEPCCDGARCVPGDLVDDELKGSLDVCGGGNDYCVPDDYIAWAGLFTPPTCSLPGDVEGRCLSTCLPLVAEKVDDLPQAECAANARCVPCCDPFTGEDLGVCDSGCDTGPAGGICEIAYAPCCEKKGGGHCVPEEAVSLEDAESLDTDSCTTGFLCAPDALADPDFVPESCSGEIPFLASYEGVCLPKCLSIPLDILIWSGTCDKTDDCVPCDDPLTGQSTGAPGCP